MQASFSPDYRTARDHFRHAATALGCTVEAHAIRAPDGAEVQGPAGEQLTIDIARIGAEKPAKLVVVSSGLHGVEGFFGSAVQAALLEGALGTVPADTAVVMLHALNPFGFAWLRRVNEDNADLNRNFLLPGEEYRGAPDGYAALDGLLNPKSPPPKFEPFLVKAGWQIARHGLPTLRNAVAGGQYDFPQGVFYGGARPSATVGILGEVLPRLVGTATQVLHVDFHTGLGARGRYKLFVDHLPATPRFAELSQRFGANEVQPWDASKGISYRIRGGLGTWCKALLPNITYDVLAAEFGTRHVLQVIAALRRENRAWQWSDHAGPASVAAREALRDVFAPPEAGWRDQVVPAGIQIVRSAIG